MPTPVNILQNVQTYQKAELAWMLNDFVAMEITNKKFNNFNETVLNNLGDTVTFDVTPRFRSNNGLVITQQPSVQRLQTLACTQATNVSAGYSDTQFIFNVQDYMDRFGNAAAKELGTAIESDVLRNIVSGVSVNDPQSPNFGQVQTYSGPYRFFGNGLSPINSSTQLAQMVANFRAIGAADYDMVAILPIDRIPAIIGTNLNQFAMTRNNEEAHKWELGDFDNTKWYQSNLLPIHVSGTIANAAAPNNIMTVVSTNDPTGQNVTQITFTEPTGGTDANAVKQGDMFQFNDVAGFPNMRSLTFIGHALSSQPVQFIATADAATVAGTVTVSVRTVNGAANAPIGLVWAVNQNQNVNNTVQAGMTVTPVPSHLAGLLMSGNQFYLAMPTLPDESPFTTVQTRDQDSGANIRHYWGSQFGLNNRAYVRDSVWGSTLVPENSMRICFSL